MLRDYMIIDDRKSNEFYLSQKEKARKHKRLYHYTDLESLSAILKTKTFKLNNICNMNDLIENQRLDYMYKGKLYISCFTYSDDESIPLWYLYGVMKNYAKGRFNNKGIIRLSISNVKEDDSFEVPFYLEAQNKKELFLKRNTKSFYIKDVSILDVLYDNELINACIEDNPFNDSYVDYFPTLAGYVKGSAWAFEEETRIRVGLVYGGFTGEIEKQVGCRYILKEPNAPKEIFLPVKDSVLRTLKFTFSPWADEVEKENFKEIVRSFVPYIKEDCFKDSLLEGKISSS